MLMVTNWCVIQLEREATLTTTNLDLLPRQTRTMSKKMNEIDKNLAALYNTG